MFWDTEVIEYIEEKLLQTWSPEQISNYPCHMTMPSFKTIYRWIYDGYVVKGNVKVLRKKGKTRKRFGKGGRFTTGKSIRKRDKSVYKRNEIGHWEADTVVSGLGKSKACFATFAERQGIILQYGCQTERRKVWKKPQLKHWETYLKKW